MFNDGTTPRAEEPCDSRCGALCRVGVATGFVMFRCGINEAEANRFLHRLAQALGCTTHDAADALV